MPSIIINFSIVLVTAVMMEFVAYFTHKYLMHGWLWSWHADHHNPRMNEGFFEKNDLFFLVFALPSMLCYIFGSLEGFTFLFYVGVGISVYGLIYFLIHDVYIHQRFKWFRQLDTKYSRAILRAHGDHHKVTRKEGCTSFGLLVVDPKYYKKRSEW